MIMSNFGTFSSRGPAPVPSFDGVVGDLYGGGKVAYILGSGDVGYDPNVKHGLILYSGAYIASSTSWSSTTSSVGGLSINGGLNTERIVTAKSGDTNCAAIKCANFSNTVNGVIYDDWFLPSTSEIARCSLSVLSSTLNSSRYWSSNENASNGKTFSKTVSLSESTKTDAWYVTCMRYF